MGLRLILGRAGSGRTHRCLDEVAAELARAREGPMLLLLTPEQGAFTLERALAARTGGHVRARVLGFTRLCDLVFEHGKAPARPRLTATHREMLVASIVRRRRAEDPSSLFATRGIEPSLAALVAETRMHAVDPERLRACSSDPTLPAALREKAAALAGFLDEYARRMEARFLDPAEALLTLSQAIATAPILQGTEAWIDGFHGLTPLEERVIEALLRRCVRVTVSLCLDPERGRALIERGSLAPHPVFAHPEETLQRLLRVADAAGAPIDPPVCLPEDSMLPRFRSAPALGVLERRFLVRRGGPVPGAPAQLQLVEAESLRDEARGAAETCAAWIADGVHPMRIAVLARAMDDYAPHLAEAFAAARIPIFLDRNEPLDAHPLVQGIASAVRAVRSGWQADDVIDAAKSGLLPVTRRQADLLAAWCAAHPPAPADWRAVEPWPPRPPRQFLEDEPRQIIEDKSHDKDPLLAGVDEARRAVAEPLLALEAALAGALRGTMPFRGVIDAVRALADAWVAAQPAPDAADETIAARLDELLDEGDEALGDEQVAIADAAELLDIVLGGIALPRIPPSLGQVTAGDLERTRLGTTDAVIVLGWGADMMPRRLRNATLLTDDDRERLSERRIEVAPSAKKLFACEAFFAYLGLTRTGGRLLLSRPRTRDGGAPQPPSIYWEDIRRLFPGIEPRQTHDLPTPERAANAAELAAARLRTMPDRSAAEASTLHALLAPLEGAPVASLVAAARDRNAPSLDPQVLHALFQARWRTSVSSLQTFARCPFQHYVRAMLRPREAMVPEPGARDAGNLAHALLKEWVDLLLARDLRFREATDPELVAEAARRVERRAQHTGLFATESGRVLLAALLREVAAFIANRLQPAMASIDAKPLATELPFGGPSGHPGMVRSQRVGELRWTIELRGQVDLVVEAPAAAGPFAVVVDYKLRGSKSFRLSDWWIGDQLQRPVYLIAMERAYPSHRVAGAFNMGILPGANDREAHEAGEFHRMRMKGLARKSFYEETGIRARAKTWSQLDYFHGAMKDPDEDPAQGTAYSEADFALLLRATDARVESALAALLGGDIAIAPRLAEGIAPCGMCDYRAICRIDPDLNCFRAEVLLGRQEALARLRAEARP